MREIERGKPREDKKRGARLIAKVDSFQGVFLVMEAST